MSSSAGGQPRTVDVPLTAPSQTVSYTLPPGVTFDVEAVYVEVDTGGAGGVVTAELTVSEQSGVVIAKKKQSATIPAGTTGSATWALRLTDETATTPGGSGIDFDTYPQAGNFLYTESTGTLTHADAVDLNTRFPGRGTGFWQSFGTLFLDSGGDDIGIMQAAGGTLDIIADTASHSVLNVEAWEWFALAFQIQITAGDNGMTLQSTGTGDVSIQAGGAGFIVLGNLPVVNPGGVGRVWNNGGFLAIT